MLGVDVLLPLEFMVLKGADDGLIEKEKHDDVKNESKQILDHNHGKDGGTKETQGHEH